MKARVTRSRKVVKVARVTKAAPCIVPGRDWRVTSCLCSCHYGEAACD